MVDLKIQLPDSFLQEEVRSGHLVTAQTKELWAVLLDLLNEFDRVCKKNNIHYFLDLGSMLGAVRHKGFVPWDEDIDISLLRKDYDRLMEMSSIGQNATRVFLLIFMLMIQYRRTILKRLSSFIQNVRKFGKEGFFLLILPNCFMGENYQY